MQQRSQGQQQQRSTTATVTSGVRSSGVTASHYGQLKSVTPSSSSTGAASMVTYPAYTPTNYYTAYGKQAAQKVCVCVCVKQKFVCNVLKVAKLTLNFLFRGKVVWDDLKILSVYVVGSDKFCGHVLKLQIFFPMTNFVWSAQTTKYIHILVIFFPNQPGATAAATAAAQGLTSQQQSVVASYIQQKTAVTQPSFFTKRTPVNPQQYYCEVCRISCACAAVSMMS